MAVHLNLLILPGDGIGPEITKAARRVADAAAETDGLRLTWDTRDIGFAALTSEGTTIPDEVIAAARAADGVVLGPVSHNEYPPVSEGGLNPSGVLRRELELYANIRPALTRGGETGPLGPVDLVVVRENLEGFYADRTMHVGTGEVMPIPGLALATRKITAEGSARIARAAFELAKGRANPRVTAVHKANVLRVSDGLFLDEVRKVAADYPDIPYDEELVDAAAALLVRDPSRFDTIVTTNMFGDILSDLASELAGGLGHGGLAQSRHAPCRRTGPARLGPRSCGARPRQPRLFDRLGRDAPGPPRAERPRPTDRNRARGNTAKPRHPHRRPWRKPWHPAFTDALIETMSTT